MMQRKFAGSIGIILILINTLSASEIKTEPSRTAPPQGARQVPSLGADFIFADWRQPMIDGLGDPSTGEEMAKAFESVGLKTLRFSFHGFYSSLGPDATARVKAENKLPNEFPWFPLDQYVDFIARHDFTTVVAVNVEEGPDVAATVLQKFNQRGVRSKLIAMELSNEPWLNHRPWMPEEYAARAADIVERLTPRRGEEPLRFGLPLTVGPDRNTPTKLSDNEWVTRMLTALSRRITLKSRTDIFGVIHLYSRGVDPRSIRYFNEVVRPFMPSVKYLVTEFNIRLSLAGNPHLTNKYAMEFARRLAALMARPEIVLLC